MAPPPVEPKRKVTLPGGSPEAPGAKGLRHVGRAPQGTRRPGREDEAPHRTRRGVPSAAPAPRRGDTDCAAARRPPALPGAGTARRSPARGVRQEGAAQGWARAVELGEGADAERYGSRGSPAPSARRYAPGLPVVSASSVVRGAGGPHANRSRANRRLARGASSYGCEAEPGRTGPGSLRAACRGARAPRSPGGGGNVRAARGRARASACPP